MFKVALLAVFILSCNAIPSDDQLMLANSLIVGNDNYSDLYAWSCKVCDSSNKPTHSHYIENEKVDVKSLISVYDDKIILAFRYTNTALNVWQDILYPLQVIDQNTCSTCKIQKAYNNMWSKIKDEVLSDLRVIKAQTGINLLYITGISLGGGLAVISYIDIAFESVFDDVKVVTFGAPRVGNKDWANHFDLITLGATKRYVLDGDPIAGMPTCLTLLCTYRQTGIRIVCYLDQEQCIEEPQSDKNKVSSVLHPISSTLRNLNNGLDSIIDHIKNYPKIYNFTLKAR